MANGAVAQQETPQERLARLRAARSGRTERPETPQERLARLRSERAAPIEIGLPVAEPIIVSSPSSAERAPVGPDAPRPADRAVGGAPDRPGFFRRILSRFSGPPAGLREAGYSPSVVAEQTSRAEGDLPMEQQAAMLAGEGMPFIQQEISIVPREEREHQAMSFLTAVSGALGESRQLDYHGSGIGLGTPNITVPVKRPEAEGEEIPEFMNDPKQLVETGLQLLRLQRPDSVHPVTGAPLTDEERERFRIAGTNILAAQNAAEVIAQQGFSGVRLAELAGSWIFPKGPGPQKRARQRIGEAMAEGWVLTPQELQALGLVDEDGKMISIHPDDLSFNWNRDLLEPLALAVPTLPIGAATGTRVAAATARAAATRAPRVARIAERIARSRVTRTGTTLRNRMADRAIRAATEGAVTGAVLAAREAEIRGENPVEAALFDIGLGTAGAGIIELGGGAIYDVVARRFRTLPEIRALRSMGNNMRGPARAGDVDPRVYANATSDRERELLQRVYRDQPEGIPLGEARDPLLGTLDTPTRRRRQAILDRLASIDEEINALGRIGEGGRRRAVLEAQRRALREEIEAITRLGARARAGLEAEAWRENARLDRIAADNDATIARRSEETFRAAHEFREGITRAQAARYEAEQAEAAQREVLEAASARAQAQRQLDDQMRDLDREAMELITHRVSGKQYERKMKSIARRRAALLGRATLPLLGAYSIAMAGEEDDHELPGSAETGLAALTLMSITNPSRSTKLGRTVLRTSIPREALSVGRFGFLTGLDDLDQAAKRELQTLVDQALRDPDTGENLVGRIVNRTNGTSYVSVERPGMGAYMGDVSANTIESFDDDVPLDHIAQVASLRGLMEGQDAQTYWRYVPEAERATTPNTVAGFVVTGVDGDQLATREFQQLMELIKTNPRYQVLDGSTFVDGHMLFKNHADVSDSEYQNLLAEALQQLDPDTEMHVGRFEGDYLDGPQSYLAVIGRNPDAIRQAGDLLSANVAPVYEQFARARGGDAVAAAERIAAVREGLESLARNVDDQANRARQAVPREGQRRTVDEVRTLLSKRYRNLGRATPQTRIARSVERGLDNLLQWARDFKGREDWYQEDLARAHATLAFTVPETRDPAMKTIFNAVLAITSSGQEPTPNWSDAIAIFRQFVKTGDLSLFESGSRGAQRVKRVDSLGRQYNVMEFRGEFLGDVGGIKRRTQAVEQGLERVQLLIRQKGKDGAAEELRSMIPRGPGKKNRGVLIPAATRILAKDGPKIGRFFANLEAMESEVTVDLWMKRLWNMWTGQATPDEVITSQGDEIRDIITKIAQEASLDPRFGGREFSPSEVQALLWHGIKDEYRRAGTVTSDESFADAATNFLFGRPSQGTMRLGAVAGAGAIAEGAPAGEDVERISNLNPALGGALAVATIGLIFQGVKNRQLRKALMREMIGRRRSEARAAMDRVTGVASRLAWDDALPAAEADNAMAVILFDVGNLKVMNDGVSSSAGDALLARSAAAIKEAADEAGYGARVFRVGGDEFGVLAPYEVAEQIAGRAKQIMGVTENPRHPEFSHFLRSGIGNNVAEADELMRAAKALEADQGLRGARRLTNADGNENGFSTVQMTRQLAQAGAAAVAGGAVGGVIDSDDPVRGAKIGAGLLLASSIGASVYGARRAARLAGGVAPAPASRRILMDPDVAAVAGQISWDPAGAPKQQFRGYMRRVYQQIFDDFAAVRRFGTLVGDTRRLSAEATRTRGAAGAAHQRLETQFREVLAAASGIEEQVAALAAAERALELADNGLGNKLARSTRAQQEAAVALLRADPRVRAGADKLRAYYTNMLHDKYVNGVITKDQMDAILHKNQLYISFMREADEALETATGAGSIFSGSAQLYNTNAGIKKMREGDVTLRVLDPYRQAVQDTFGHEARVAKQRVFQVVADIVERNPAGAEPFIKEIAEPRSVTALERGSVIGAIVNGQKRYYQVLDKDILEGLQGLAPESRGLAVRMLSNVKNLLRAGVTTIPAFGVANAIRDNVFTALSMPFSAKRAAGGFGAGMVTGAAFPGLFDADDQDTNRLKSGIAGGAIGLAAAQFAPHVARTLDAMRGMLRLAPAMQGGAVIGSGVGAFTAEEGERTEGAIAGAAIGAGLPAAARAITRSAPFAKLFGSNEQVGEAYREWMREGGAGFGWFPRTSSDTKRVLQELRSEGVSMEDVLKPRTWWDALQFINRAIEEAPRVARYRFLRAEGTPIPEAVEGSRTVSLDFSRRGSQVATIASTTAFWNPKMQGFDKIGRLLADKNTWMVGLTVVTAPTLALWAINSELPEYWERPQWERNMFWLVPKQLFGGSDGFYRIPKPFEPGFVFASIPERFADYLHQKDPERMREAMKDMVQTTFDGVLPIPTAVEAVISPMIGEAGFDTFRQQPIVAPEYQRYTPAIQGQLDPQVSSVAAGISQVVPIQPAKIDNMIVDVTGTIGALALRELSQIARSVGLDPRPQIPDAPRSQWERFVTTGRVMSDPEREVLRRFKAVGKVVNDADALLERGLAQQAEDYINHNLEALIEADQLEGVREMLKLIWTARDVIAEDPNTDNATKLERLKELRRLAARVAEAGLRNEPLEQPEVDELRELEDVGQPQVVPPEEAGGPLPEPRQPEETPEQRLQRLRNQRRERQPA